MAEGKFKPAALVTIAGLCISNLAAVTRCQANAAQAREADARATQLDVQTEQLRREIALGARTQSADRMQRWVAEIAKFSHPEDRAMLFRAVAATEFAPQIRNWAEQELAKLDSDLARRRSELEQVLTQSAAPLPGEPVRSGPKSTAKLAERLRSSSYELALDSLRRLRLSTPEPAALPLCKPGSARGALNSTDTPLCAATLDAHGALLDPADAYSLTQAQALFWSTRASAQTAQCRCDTD